jgi:hypothetical protein
MAFTSKFPSLPGDTGRTLGSGSGATVGFAGNTVIVKDLFETMRKFSNASPQFDKEMRKVGATIAEDLKQKVIIEAGTVSRARQALAVAKGFRVIKSDRLPTLELRGSSPFPSKSRPPSKRNKKVTRSDVFFGAEFGGGARPTTRQFLRHRGQSGYFFWPTVRKRKNAIAKEYLDGMDRVVKELGIG